jgi:hypothetical protein
LVILLLKILLKLINKVLKMINWQIIQLLATGLIMLSGPAVIVLLALKKGNL